MCPLLLPCCHRRDTRIQTNKRWVHQSVFLCWSPCSCFPLHSSLTCQWMKTSWNFLAKSIWLLPWCPSHKFPSLSLLSFLFLCHRSCCFCWVPLVIRCQELLLCVMGSSRKSVRMKYSLLHAHTANGSLPYGIAIFHTECGKMDDDSHLHSAAPIRTYTCCSILWGRYIDLYFFNILS